MGHRPNFARGALVDQDREHSSVLLYSNTFFAPRCLFSCAGLFCRAPDAQPLVFDCLRAAVDGSDGSVLFSMS
jgi:hypothetical protein